MSKFNVKQSLGEIVLELPGAAEVFEKYRIDFCCGGRRSLGEALAEVKIDENEVLDSLDKEYENAKAASERFDFREMTDVELIDFIVNTHHVYVKKVLPEIQKTLFTCGSILATDTSKNMSKPPVTINSTIISTLEKEIDRMQNTLPPLSNFILPGGSITASHCHIARTVCRRAERRVVALNNFVEIESQLVVFINRLSDYLFALSRFINFKSGNSETTWHTGE